MPRSGFSIVLYRVLTLARRGPLDGFVGGRARSTTRNFNLVRNDEGGVETNAELADKLRIVLGVATQA